MWETPRLGRFALAVVVFAFAVTGPVTGVSRALSISNRVAPNTDATWLSVVVVLFALLLAWWYVGTGHSLTRLFEFALAAYFFAGAFWGVLDILLGRFGLLGVRPVRPLGPLVVLVIAYAVAYALVYRNVDARLLDPYLVR